MHNMQGLAKNISRGISALIKTTKDDFHHSDIGWRGETFLTVTSFYASLDSEHGRQAKGPLLHAAHWFKTAF